MQHDLCMQMQKQSLKERFISIPAVEIYDFIYLLFCDF